VLFPVRAATQVLPYGLDDDQHCIWWSLLDHGCMAGAYIVQRDFAELARRLPAGAAEPSAGNTVPVGSGGGGGGGEAAAEPDAEAAASELAMRRRRRRSRRALQEAGEEDGGDRGGEAEEARAEESEDAAAGNDEQAAVAHEGRQQEAEEDGEQQRAQQQKQQQAAADKPLNLAAAAAAAEARPEPHVLYLDALPDLSSPPPEEGEADQRWSEWVAACGWAHEQKLPPPRERRRLGELAARPVGGMERAGRHHMRSESADL
jgi:hypothetical protein